MVWFKGKSAGNHGFSDKMWGGFLYLFPSNRSIDSTSTGLLATVGPRTRMTLTKHQMLHVTFPGVVPDIAWIQNLRTWEASTYMRAHVQLVIAT